jgi:hypothetical protein
MQSGWDSFVAAGQQMVNTGVSFFCEMIMVKSPLWGMMKGFFPCGDFHGLVQGRRFAIVVTDKKASANIF